MGKIELNVVSNQNARLVAHPDGYFDLSAEFLFGGLQEGSVIIEHQLLVFSEEYLLAASEPVTSCLSLEDASIWVSAYFFRGKVKGSMNYQLSYRLYSEHEERRFSPALPPEISRQSGAFSIFEPSKKLFSSEKSSSGPIKLESIVIRNVAGEDDSVFINLSSKDPCNSGFLISCESNDAQTESDFQMMEKPMKSSYSLGLHLHDELDVKLKGFSALSWEQSSKFSCPQATPPETFEDEPTRENESREGVVRISGSVAIISLQYVEEVDALEFATPASGFMKGPTRTFSLAFDSDSEDYWLVEEGKKTVHAAAKDFGWEAPSKALEEIASSLANGLGIKSQDVKDLIFYLQANITDEAEDIEDSAYTHEYLSADAAGEINLALHFSDVSDAANRIWVSTAQNSEYIDIEIDSTKNSITFDDELLSQREAIAWLSDQIRRVDTTKGLKSHKSEIQKLENMQVAQIAVFLPKPDDPVYLQWSKDDASEGAKGPVFQFSAAWDLASGDDVCYTQLDENLEKISDNLSNPRAQALVALVEPMSAHLAISKDLAKEIIQYIEALLDDEAEDLDNSRFNYNYSDRLQGFPELLSSFGGEQKNRIHIRIRDNIFQSSEEMSVLIENDMLSFETDSLGYHFAISEFEHIEKEVKMSGSVASLLEMKNFYCMRFGSCNSESNGDFIDNIDGRFNLYIATGVSPEGDEYLCLFHNDKFKAIKNSHITEILDSFTGHMPQVFSTNIAKALIQSGHDNDPDGIIDHAPEFEEHFFDTRADDLVDGYKPCFFTYSSITYDCGSQIDQHTGAVHDNDEMYEDMSAFFGCVDEDEGYVVGIIKYME
jgi:hypothetical protein